MGPSTVAELLRRRRTEKGEEKRPRRNNSNDYWGNDQSGLEEVKKTWPRICCRYEKAGGVVNRREKRSANGSLGDTAELHIHGRGLWRGLKGANTGAWTNCLWASCPKRSLKQLRSMSGATVPKWNEKRSFLEIYSDGEKGGKKSPRR